jgi:hypothetical protein
LNWRMYCETVACRRYIINANKLSRIATSRTRLNSSVSTLACVVANMGTLL